MIGLLFNMLFALGVTYWILKDDELILFGPLGLVLFMVVFNSFEIGRLHRKINQLLKRRKHLVNWKEMQEVKYNG